MGGSVGPMDVVSHARTIGKSPARLVSAAKERLVGLDDYLTELGRPGTVAADLHERLRILPQPSPMTLPPLSK